jgi:hypothetical protein
MQVGRDVIINAPSKPVQVIYNKGFAGVWFASSSANFRNIDGLLLMHNAADGMEHQNGGAAGLHISNAIIAQNGATNLRISDVGINQPITLNNVTISNQGTGSPIIVNAAATASISLTDSIVAGNGSAAANNSITHNGTGTLTLSGTALVTAGPNALATPPISGTGPVSGTPSTTADPQFVEIRDNNSAGLYDVANTAYATASSTSGPLGGGGDYVGAASVQDWSVY